MLALACLWVTGCESSIFFFFLLFCILSIGYNEHVLHFKNKYFILEQFWIHRITVNRVPVYPLSGLPD